MPPATDASNMAGMKRMKEARAVEKVLQSETDAEGRGNRRKRQNIARRTVETA